MFYRLPACHFNQEKELGAEQSSSSKLFLTNYFHHEIYE